MLREDIQQTHLAPPHDAIPLVTVWDVASEACKDFENLSSATQVELKALFARHARTLHEISERKGHTPRIGLLLDNIDRFAEAGYLSITLHLMAVNFIQSLPENSRGELAQEFHGVFEPEGLKYKDEVLTRTIAVDGEGILPAARRLVSRTEADGPLDIDAFYAENFSHLLAQLDQ